MADGGFWEMVKASSGVDYTGSSSSAAGSAGGGGINQTPADPTKLFTPMPVGAKPAPQVNQSREQYFTPMYYTPVGGYPEYGGGGLPSIVGGAPKQVSVTLTTPTQTVGEYGGFKATAPAGVPPLPEGTFILPAYVNPDLSFVIIASGRPDVSYYDEKTGKMVTPEFSTKRYNVYTDPKTGEKVRTKELEYTGLTYQKEAYDPLKPESGKEYFISRAELEQLKQDWYAGKAAELKAASNLKTQPQAEGGGVSQWFTPMKPETVQTQSRLITTGAGEGVKFTAIAPLMQKSAGEPALPWADLNKLLFPYAGKEMRTYTNTPDGYTLTVEKYPLSWKPAPETKQLQAGAFRSLAEAQTGRLKAALEAEAKGGSTSAAYSEAERLALAKGAFFVPSKDFGRSKDAAGFNEQLERMGEAFKGAASYTAYPFFLLRDIEKATVGRAALFTVQLARGQREEAIKTATETPLAVGGTFGAIGGGIAGSIAEAARGNPAMVGGLAIPALGTSALGQFAKGGAIKASFKEGVLIENVERGASGLVVSGEVKNVARASGREVATVERFTEIVLNPDKVVNFVERVTKDGVTYTTDMPTTFRQEVVAVSEGQGFQQGIKGTVLTAEQLGVHVDKTVKGMFAENVQPTKSSGVSVAPSNVARLEEAMQPASLKFAYAMEKAVNNLNPPQAVSNFFRKITLGEELSVRGGLISTGEGALTGGGAVGTIGGKAFETVGVSRFELAKPSFEGGMVLQSYIGQSMLVKGGKGSATGKGMVLMPSELLAEFGGGAEAMGMGKKAEINRLVNQNAEMGLAYEKSLNFNEKGAQAFAQFQRQVMGGKVEGVRGASMVKLMEMRNAAISQAVGAQRPALVLGASYKSAMGFGKFVGEEELFKPSLPVSTRGTFAFEGGGYFGGEVNKIKMDIKIPQTTKGQVGFEGGMVAALKDRFALGGGNSIVNRMGRPFEGKFTDTFAIENPFKEELRQKEQQSYSEPNTYKEITKYQTEYINRNFFNYDYGFSGFKGFFALPPMGGGGALGEKASNVKTPSRLGISEAIKEKLFARADPFTQVVSQLRTGRSPMIAQTPKTIAAFRHEVLRHPLLVRFGGRI